MGADSHAGGSLCTSVSMHLSLHMGAVTVQKIEA